MIITIYKQNLIRTIDQTRKEEFLAAGWHLEPVSEDVITLKPTTRAKAVVNQEPGNAINQGDE
jgi:hypothetical protein